MLRPSGKSCVMCCATSRRKLCKGYRKKEEDESK